MSFITLEGPEGGGKTLQLARLGQWLQTRGYPVVATREPGGTDIGDQIRRVIMGMENRALVPEAELLLFSAARAQHVRELIRPALERGALVLCDRFSDATLAYQGYGHRLPLEPLREITRFATGGLVPDLTLLLDLPIEAGLRRRRAAASGGGEWNRLDDQALEFHRRVRAGYHDLVAHEPARWRVIDADRPEEDVEVEIRETVAAFLATQSSHSLPS